MRSKLAERLSAPGIRFKALPWSSRIALVFLMVIAAGRHLRAGHRPARSAGILHPRHPARRRALLRHRPAGPRHLLPPALRRPVLAADRPRRRRPGPGGGRPARLARRDVQQGRERTDHAPDGHPDGVPRHRPGRRRCWPPSATRCPRSSWPSPSSTRRSSPAWSAPTCSPSTARTTSGPSGSSAPAASTSCSSTSSATPPPRCWCSPR